ncbi:MAG TPA: multicopper oxidase domain-containing protein, partial [Longimicrobium sp.]|nr:multicopper oxidase domain-containing protein [Longimicrobium sp.]
MSFAIKGKVIDESTGAGAPGVRVEAWDSDHVSDDFVGWAVTGADGGFAIEFNEVLTAELYDVWPDLYFRVYQSGVLLLSTEHAISWNVQSPLTEVTLVIPRCPTQPPCVTRDIYLKIERVTDYSTVRPTAEKLAPHIQYGRDCMRLEGHENGLIPEAEIEARSLTAVVYREYLDSAYLVPKPDKLILADINEPPFHHRVPGTVIYTRACERLKIHVWNTDDVPHSFHVHGLRYGIDSDGSWPFGTQNHHDVRSDAICPGQTFTYLYDVTEKMRGPWPFHDHTHHHASKIERGLIGGIVVLAPWERPPRCFRYPALLLEELYAGVLQREGLTDVRVALPEHLLVADHDHAEVQPVEGGAQETGGHTHTHTHEGGVHAHDRENRGGGRAHGHEQGAGHARHEAEGAGHGHSHEAAAGSRQPVAEGGAVTAPEESAEGGAVVAPEEGGLNQDER